MSSDHPPRAAQPLISSRESLSDHLIAWFLLVVVAGTAVLSWWLA
jgi:hypothetical protein